MRSDRPIGQSKVWCSHCGKLGHNRRNVEFHPKLPPLAGGHKNPKYKGEWYRNTRLRASLREVCMSCGGSPGKRDKRGNPSPWCADCLKYMADQQKKRRQERNRFEEALRVIASGTCPNPAMLAATALGLELPTQTLRAA